MTRSYNPFRHPARTTAGKRDRRKFSRRAYFGSGSASLTEGRRAHRATRSEERCPRFLGGSGLTASEHARKQASAKRGAKTRTDPFGFKAMQKNFGG